jgi:hypothetical protein
MSDLGKKSLEKKEKNLDLFSDINSNQFEKGYN